MQDRLTVLATATLLVAVAPLSAQRQSRAPLPTTTVTTEVTLEPRLRQLELAGKSIFGYPHFEYVRTLNEGSLVQMALDPLQVPLLRGRTVDVYITAARTAAEYLTDPVLVDAGTGVRTVTTGNGSIEGNRFTLDLGTLSGDAGAGLGVGYDIVIDRGRDGFFDEEDWIDGGGDEAGFYVAHDVTLPGPYPVTEVLYSGGTFLQQDTYYPSNIASLGEQPLVIVSHGNGHNYQWYDHIGEHLASYGYVVMSHSNNTVPGIETASTTTLTNTDYFLGNLDAIAGGVLEGHVNTDRITWIGHSRGGEGVVRAYSRLLTGQFTPSNYDASNIHLISSIAPTNFFDFTNTNPEDVIYHLWVGGSDADVSGCANSRVVQSFALHDRARQFRQSISLYGVGHGDFHDGGGSSVATGPCRVGRANTHTIMRGYVLPLLEYHVRDNVAAKDFLWRQWEGFRPIGAPTGSCVVADLMFREGEEAGSFVLDDFQSNPSPALSSSGGNVTTNLTDLVEGLLDDGTNSFVNNAADPMNGMTVGTSGDDSRGVVFSYDNVNRVLAFEIPPGRSDVSGFEFLSLRACQATRHPLTTAVLGDQLFEVRLTDSGGASSTMSIAASGGGLEEPYQRTNCGSGTGWNNEWETVRLRLQDFTNGSGGALPGILGLNLTDLVLVELLFGPAHGNAQGRLGVDELRFEVD